MKNESIYLKQNEVLFDLKQQIEKKHINENNMYLVILSKDKVAKEWLPLLDNVNRELDNSIKFGDFHRGVKYLALIKLIYERIFNDNKLDEYKQKIDDFMRM